MAEDEPKGSFVRWQSITIAQLTYSVNLILGFAVASLGFEVVLLLNTQFSPVGWQKCAFFVSILLLLLSIGLGIWCVVNRLKDFRTTMKAAQMRERREKNDAREKNEAEERIQRYRDLYEKRGKRTWILFWWQIGTFGAGILCAVLGLSASISQKLL